MDLIKRMKSRLRSELAMEGISPTKLGEMCGIAKSTVDRYLSPHLYGTKVEIWLMISQALGYEGLEWLICEEVDTMSRMSQLALDYISRMLRKTEYALENARKRSGVTDEEIINLQQKLAVIEWIKALIETEMEKENAQ